MEKLNQLLGSFDSLYSDFVRVQTIRNSELSKLEELHDKINSLITSQDVLEKVSELFRRLIDQEVIDNAKTAEGLLTEGLQAIFDDLDLSAKARVDVQRGKVSLELLTVQTENDGSQTEGLSTDAYGGSVTTVQSVLLRIVVLTRRGMRPLLLLDESLAAIAESYVPRVGEFLSILSERLGLDVLAVTHNPALIEQAKTAYRIQKKNGEATFSKIRRAP